MLRILWPALGKARVWELIMYHHKTMRIRPKSLAFIHDDPKSDNRDPTSYIKGGC